MGLKGNPKLQKDLKINFVSPLRAGVSVGYLNTAAVWKVLSRQGQRLLQSHPAALDLSPEPSPLATVGVLAVKWLCSRARSGAGALGALDTHT